MEHGKHIAAWDAPESNGDGVVDASDARRDTLRVWGDLNQDGMSQTDAFFLWQRSALLAHPCFVLRLA